MFIVSACFFVYSLILMIVFNKKLSKELLVIPYIFCGIFISYFVSTNIAFLSRDYINYIFWFEEIRTHSFFDILFLNDTVSDKDIGFQLLVSSIQNLISPQYSFLFFVFCFLIFYLKYKIVSFLPFSLSVIFALWLIFAQTFILFEVTQIRAGLAITLASYAIVRGVFFEKNNIFTFVIFLFAVSVHLSTLVLALIYYIYIFKKFNITPRMIIFLIFSGVILNLFFINFINFIFTKYFSENLRFTDYLENSESLSLFSIFLISKLLIIFFLLYFWNSLNDFKKFIVFLSGIGCFFQITFSFNVVFGLRFSELFILFSMLTFVFPFDIKLISQPMRYLYLIFILALSLVFYSSTTKILIG